MAAFGVSPAMAARWKWFLIVLCGLCAARLVIAAFDVFGFAASPWYGWWDVNFYSNGTPT